MTHNPTLLALIVFDAFALMMLNMFGMYGMSVRAVSDYAVSVTQLTTAVHRTIAEACRTLCIWLTNLVIYYLVTCNYGLSLILFSALVCCRHVPVQERNGR